MKKTGIFFGSSTGTTEDIARRLAKLLNVADADIHNVADTAPDAVAEYDVLVMGSPTWGAGDLQDDWYDFLAGVKALDLAGKKIAIFGLGDETMSDTFCDAVGTIYNDLKPTGATFIGAWPDSDFHFDSSTADEDGVAVGLLLDEVNHADLTDSRLEAWAKALNNDI